MRWRPPLLRYRGPPLQRLPQIMSGACEVAQRQSLLLRVRHWGRWCLTSGTLRSMKDLQTHVLKKPPRNNWWGGAGLHPALIANTLHLCCNGLRQLRQDVQERPNRAA